MSKGRWPRLVLFVMLAAVVTSTTALAGNSLLTQTSSVEGTVTDKHSHQPLGGVRVYIEGTAYSARTDDDGWFCIDYLLPGEYTAIVTKHGYRQEEIKFSVKAKRPITRDIKLRRQ